MLDNDLFYSFALNLESFYVPTGAGRTFIFARNVKQSTIYGHLLIFKDFSLKIMNILEIIVEDQQ